MRARLLVPAVLALALSAAAAAADIVAEPRLRLEGARYEPTDPELIWTGWIGGAVALVRGERTAFDFTYEMETIMGEVIRPFEATQANFHLEGALRHRFGALEAGPFFHHVSRHAIDRSRGNSVDWNVVGLRLEGRWPHRRFLFSVGHTTRASVGYGWEVIARADSDLLRGAAVTPYVAGELRLVTADPVTHLSLLRGDFTDVRVEAGPRWRRGLRSLALFVAYERRNDVFLEEAAARDRALFGFRILLDRGAEQP